MPWNRIYYERGEQVGDCIFLHDVHNVITNVRKAMFECKCGKHFIANINKVKICETRSCGCAYFGINKTHGLSGHPLHQVWKSMKARCYNKNANQYDDYGGRGIAVCDEWKKDFQKFYDWAISNGWKKGLQLDKDTKGGKIYSPDTCCFITAKKNSNRRRSSRILKYNEQSKTVSEWADYYGISLKNLYQRMSRGWSFEKCISQCESA